MSAQELSAESVPLAVSEYEADVPTLDTPPEVKPQTPSRRLDALDAFRGLTIFGMLLVNNIALDWHTPDQLKHAPWNGGVRFADLVFPWFLLIVGVAIPYAWASHRRKGWGVGRYLAKAVTRAIALVALGCLIDSSIARTPIFDLDVLQLIGLAYLAATFFALLLPLVPRVVFAFLLLFGHWVLLKHVHVPGMPTGTLEPTRNVISYVNQHFLQRYHLAGLVSVVPASALVLMGSVLGDLMRRERFALKKRLLILMGWGLALTALGWLWSMTLPFNKPVWTASYILFSGGLGALVLGALYALLDVWRKADIWNAWALPLRVFGSNAIAAYVAPILVKLYVLQVWTWPGTQVTLQHAFLHSAVRHWGVVGGGWVYTLGYIGIWWLVLLVLYRRQVFLRV